jgi:2-polyprenyl-6-hydroxyphenyl methylase/3-demethylubiquinone-9 3-methyltransferase
MFRQQISAGPRFEFGKNWGRFLRTISDDNVAAAERAMTSMLGNIRGKTFLDIGCGSGLSSLAAHRLGAKVRAFDYDPQCVACARELQRRYGASWPVEQASALDRAYLARLGTFDIVYSWGVLHHTGEMWTAMDAISVCVKDTLFIAIYNDANRASRFWLVVKRLYNRTPWFLRWWLVVPLFMRRRLVRIMLDAFKGKPLASWKAARGMNPWVDFIDWIGGYPYEFAKPEEVFSFWKARGFQLERLATKIGIGCNEFVFRRQPRPGPTA